MTDYERGLEKLGFLGTHHEPMLDVREAPAFAWRVLEVLAQPEHMVAKDGFTMALWDNQNPTDALYAAVCALGREP